MRFALVLATPIVLALAAAGPPGGVPRDGVSATAAGLTPASLQAEAGTDATRVAVLGVRLYMSAADAQQALERAGLPASAWHERDVACADQAPGEAPSCVALAVLTGPIGVTVRFVEDLPRHPHSSVVAEVQCSEEPRTSGAQAAYHRHLLALYGPPDLSDAVGLQWGRLTGPAGHQAVVRTRPMLESSHDEMVRLSDTGFEEREALLATRQRAARRDGGVAVPGGAGPGAAGPGAAGPGTASGPGPDPASGAAGPTASSGATAGPGAGAS